MHGQGENEFDQLTTPGYFAIVLNGLQRTLQYRNKIDKRDFFFMKETTEYQPNQISSYFIGRINGEEVEYVIPLRRSR